jgi:LemA protein
MPLRGVAMNWAPSQTQLGVLLGAAVLVFWMVGAYNRLVALRTRLGGAYAQVDDLLQRRAAAVRALATALRGPLSAETPALDAMLAAQAQVASAADALRARPVMASHAAALVAAEALMRSSSSRVLALVEQHPALVAAPDIAPTLATLHELPTRLGFARQVYNDAAAAYNEAARQFPTRLLTRLYGFGTAGRL